MPKLNKYDKEHVGNLSAYEKQVYRLYRQIIQQAATIGISISGDFNPDKPFSFDDYPTIKKRIEKLLSALQSGLSGVILNGIDAEWTLANNKNSELSQMVFGDNIGKLSEEQYKRYFSTNDNARIAFKERKENGLNLSDRVWCYTNQFKDEIELALDLGIRSGLSADEMTRDLRDYLRYPDKLFRRVRDEHGQLLLSKRAAAFHPGQGVYRSSYKNARRLAATETNMAYMTADYERWQQLDFVVGIEIRLSNNHTLNGEPFVDICDDLKGRYPKDFKFTGWHPHCRCHVITILKTDEEIAEDTQKILNGEELDGNSVNRVEDVPNNFKKWVNDNADRIKTAKKQPYFIRDNKKVVDGILADNKPSVLNDVIKKLDDAKVEYLPVKKLPKQLSEEEIISRVGGGDLTQGSCASLAFAWAANKGGLDVLDFRDGNSRIFFSRYSNLMQICENVGGISSFTTTGIQLMKKTEIGKQYYIVVGCHAAIVRQISRGKYQFLELQSSIQNGWKPLDGKVFKWRFRESGKDVGLLIDIELLQKDPGFQKMVGYINTAQSEQRKGTRGTIK